MADKNKEYACTQSRADKEPRNTFSEKIQYVNMKIAKLWICQCKIYLAFPIECFDSGAPTSLLYSYGKSFNGFVAMLTHDQEIVKVAGE